MSPRDTLALSLREAGAAEVCVHRALLALASTVFRDALETEPDVERIEVDGPLWAWQEIVHRLYPHPHASVRELSGPEVLELCPVAHRYDISAVLADCVARAQGLTFVSSQDVNHPLHPLVWIRLGWRLSEDALAAGAWRHIFLAAERKAKHGSSYMDAQLLLSMRKGAEGLPPGLVCALNQLADVFVATRVAAVVGKEQQAECPWALHLMG